MTLSACDAAQLGLCLANHSRATERDPTADLRGALPPAKHQHFASITEPTLVGALLRAIDGFRGSFVVQCALRLAPMLFVRPGELRKAMWKDFDLHKGEWSYLSTKKNKHHIVPLYMQALDILRTPIRQHCPAVPWKLGCRVAVL